MSIKRILKYTLISIFGLIVLMIIVGIFASRKPEQSEQIFQPTTKYLKIGEEGIINNNSDKNDLSGVAVLGVSKEALNKFIDTQIADDKIGYLQMLGRGELFIVDNGISVKVIKTSMFLREVRILEGEYFGESGWIPYEFVVSK